MDIEKMTITLSDSDTALLWRARIAAHDASQAKRDATRTNETWRERSRRPGADAHTLWIEQAQANDVWRHAQAATYAANKALLDALGCDWRTCDTAPHSADAALVVY